MEGLCTLTHFKDFVDIQNSILQITFQFENEGGVHYDPPY